MARPKTIPLGKDGAPPAIATSRAPKGWTSGSPGSRGWSAVRFEGGHGVAVPDDAEPGQFDGFRHDRLPVRERTVLGPCEDELTDTVTLPTDAAPRSSQWRFSGTRAVS